MKLPFAESYRIKMVETIKEALVKSEQIGLKRLTTIYLD